MSTEILKSASSSSYIDFCRTVTAIGRASPYATMMRPLRVPAVSLAAVWKWISPFLRESSSIQSHSVDTSGAPSAPSAMVYATEYQAPFGLGLNIIALELHESVGARLAGVISEGSSPSTGAYAELTHTYLSPTFSATYISRRLLAIFHAFLIEMV